jgi:tape measure domain-containing protein
MAIGTTLRIEFDSKPVQRGLASLGNSLKSFAAAGVAGAVAGIAASITNMGVQLAGRAVNGMYEFTKASSAAAATIENMRAQFELFTGSAEKTEGLIKELRDIAVKSPLELKDISEGARMLLTYGVEAEKVAEIINQLSEVSAGSGERFQRISYAFGQISSIGRLMGSELRQLTEAGFNPLEFISKKTGETMIQLKKRMEDGGISVGEVKEALKAATSEGGRFYGLNEKMAQTFAGRVSMMKDSWFSFTAAFGEGMNKGLKTAVNAITNSLPLFQERFRVIGETLGNSISDAVNGNFDKFVAIGALIGTILAEATKKSFKVGLRNFGASVLSALDAGENAIRDATGLTPVIGKSNLGARAKEAAVVLQREDIRQMLNAITQKIQEANIDATGLVPGTGGNARYLPPGTPSVFTDSAGNPVEVLKRIEINTREGAKM